MTIHFSIRFDDEPFTFHGEKDYGVTEEMVFDGKQALVSSIKKELEIKNKEWKKDLTTQITSFEIYFFVEGIGEKTVFQYKK